MLRIFRHCWLLLLIASLAPVATPIPTPPTALAAPAQQAAVDPSFGSAVPCLSSPMQLATTCGADTIFQPPRRRDGTPAIDDRVLAPALVLFGKGSKSPQLSLGQIGSTYGLAYDDGLGGSRRLFIGAFGQRLGAYGPGGPGAIYAYDLAGGTVRTFATLPNADRHGGRSSFDREFGPWVGKSGLGDLELSPQGDTLYAMNLHTRQVDRVDAHSGAVGTPLDLPLAAISADPAVQADLRPFGLEFAPRSAGRLLYVGLIDSAERPDADSPVAYVLALDLARPADSFVALRQSLTAPQISARFRNSVGWTDVPAWYKWGFNAFKWGNPVRRPQPMLSDIEFTPDGQTMVLAFRDRTGDQFWGFDPPSADNHVVMAQGDTLAYRLDGGVWRMLTTDVDVVPSDYFNDNYIARKGSGVVTTYDNTPFHSENHGGALAYGLSLASGMPREELAVAGLTPLAGSTGGVTWYGLNPYQRERLSNDDGSPMAVELIPRGHPAQGKAQRLGDLENLCTFALIGDFVWKDQDRDGRQDQGEPGIAGLRLDLLEGETVVASATTDAAGRYRFAVQPGHAYRIRPAAASAALAGLVPTGTKQGDDAGDSDLDPASGTVAVSARLRDTATPTFDLGYADAPPPPALPCPYPGHPTCPPPPPPPPAEAELGDRVWLDADADGVQDADESTGIDALTVELLDADSGRVLRTTRTAGGGFYRFVVPAIDRLAYRVRIALGGTNANALAGYQRSPQGRGGNDEQDSDADASGTTRSVAAPARSQNPRLDAGFYQPANVAVAKSGPAVSERGVTMTYMLTTTNTSAAPARQVVLTDTLPAGVLFVSASPNADQFRLATDAQGEPTTAARWELGTLPPGTSRVVRLTVQVKAEAGAAVRNRADVATVSYGDQPADNSSTWETAIPNITTDLVLTKSGPLSAAKDQPITYTIVYRNAGPGAAQNVRVDDTFPPTFVFEGATPPPAISDAAGATWYAGGTPANSMLAGTTATIIVRGRLITAGRWTNSAYVRTTTTETSNSNNRDQVTTDVSGPPGVNLALDKRGPATVEPGAELFYTLKISETTGNRAAENVVITDTLPPGVAFLQAVRTFGASGTARDPSTFVVSVSGNLLTIRLGTVPAGYRDTVSVQTTAPAAGLTLTNTAVVRTSTEEATLADNEDRAVTVVRLRQPVSIGDRVFLDRNGDGHRDSASEPGIAGAVLQLYRYGNTWAGDGACAASASSTLIRATTSDVSGSYSLDDAVAPASQWGDLVVVPADNFAPGGPLAGLLLSPNRRASRTDDSTDYNAAVAAVVASDGTCGSGDQTQRDAFRRAGLAPGTLFIPRLSTKPADPAGYDNSGPTAYPQRYVADVGLFERWNTALDKRGPASALAGTAFTYTLVVSNTRGVEQAAVVVSDTLPAGLRFRSANPAPSRVTGQRVEWDLALAAGATRTIQLQVDTAAETAGQRVENRACVAATVGEFDHGDDCGVAETIIIPRADLLVAKSGPAAATAGELLAYTLHYTNAGPDVARAVVLTDTLPAGLLYAGASVPPLLSGAALRWELGDLAPGASGAITLTVQADRSLLNGASRTNLLLGTTSTTETTTTNNQDEATTRFYVADLAVRKQGPASTAAGDLLRYSLFYQNLGTAPAADTVLIDQLPAGLELLGVGGTPSVAGGQLRWQLGTLAPGASGVLTVEARVDPFLAIGTVLTNTAAITTTTPDRDPTNNADQAITTLLARWGLPLVKTAQTARPDGLLVPGELVTYTLTISNPGPSATPPVLVTDTFPAAQLVLLDTTPAVSSISADGTAVSWAFDRLAPGGTATVLLHARVRSDLSLPAGTLIRNRARTSSPDGGRDDPPATPATPCLPPRCVALPFERVDLAVEKDDDQQRVTAGQQLAYRITAQNQGRLDASGVVLVERLPAGSTLVPAGSPGWNNTAEPQIVRYDLGGLAAGASSSLTITVRVDTPYSGATTLRNTVTILDDGGSGPDADPDNNTFDDLDSIETACIGDFAWLDTSLNGLQDAGEPGRSGVLLELLDDGGFVVARGRTDTAGRYRICGLGLGVDYRLRVAAINFAAGGTLERTTLVPPLADSAQQQRDSNAFPASRTSGSIRLTGDDNSIDIGVQPSVETTDIAVATATQHQHRQHLPFVSR